MYYVYIWFIKETNHVFYVGKGKENRLKELKSRNQYFLNIYNKYDCDSKIIKTFECEEDAFKYEIEMISFYRNIGEADANLHKGGRGGDVWKYASQEDKDNFIKKMTTINKERCSSQEFKKNKSEYMSNKYQNEEERRLQSERVKRAWEDEELRKRHSEIIKKSQTQEVRDKRANRLKKKVELSLGEIVVVFDSRKEMLSYLSEELSFNPSNTTLAKLLAGETYKPFRKAQKPLEGLKIRYVEEDVETIENLPFQESE